MSIAEKVHLPIAAATGLVTSVAAAVVYFDPSAAGAVAVVTPLVLGTIALLAADTPAQYDQALKSLAYDAEQVTKGTPEWPLVNGLVTVSHVGTPQGIDTPAPPTA